MTERSDFFSFENKWFRLASVFVLFGSLITILVAFRGILLPFVFAIVVAYVMEPLVRRINKAPLFGFFLPRWTAVIILYIAFATTIAAFVIFFLPPMYRELRSSVETEWVEVKHQIQKLIEEAPVEEASEEGDGEGPVHIEDEPTDPEPGDPGAISEPPPVTIDQLRLTDFEGEVVWVPRRLGPAVVNVYAPEDTGRYLDWLNARRTTAAEEGAEAIEAPSPVFSFPIEVQPGWTVESGQLTTPEREPVRGEKAPTIARLGQRTELRFRQIGSRPEESLVEIVYPPAGEFEELRDFTRRELKSDTGEGEVAEEGLDLYALGKEFLRKQARNAFNWVEKEAEHRLQKSVEYVGAIVGAVFKTVFNIILVLMLAAFMSSDLRGIQRFFFELVPPSYRPQFEELMGGVDRGLSGVIRGQLLICVINGSLTGVGLYFMDVPFWHILTIIVTVLTLIPIFGTILSSIPCVLFGLTVSFSTGVIVLVWILAIHALEAYYLNPKVMGHQAHIHPVLVVFALVAGEHTYGLIGALLAVPVASILQNLFLFIHKRLVSASEEEAQRTGVYFRRRPKILEEEEAERRRVREGKKRKKTDDLASDTDSDPGD